MSCYLIGYLAAYNISCAKMRIEARDAAIEAAIIKSILCLVLSLLRRETDGGVVGDRYKHGYHRGGIINKTITYLMFNLCIPIQLPTLLETA